MQISDEMVRVAHAEYHKVLGDKNRSDPMRAALTAALALSGWRTIDSAPKDGTWVLLGRVGIQAMHTAFYRDGVWHCGGHQYFNNPTHWKPLDAPPATAGKEG